jgi:hypothetical protein
MTVGQTLFELLKTQVEIANVYKFKAITPKILKKSTSEPKVPNITC